MGKYLKHGNFRKGEVYDVERTSYTLCEYTGKGGKYIADCKYCSRDEELWPYGRIIIRLKAILDGDFHYSCGCSKSPNYITSQYTVLINRRCEELGFIFKGFVEDGRPRNNTHLKLYNPETGNNWSSTTINSFINKNLSQDPSTARKRGGLAQSYKLEDILKLPKIIEWLNIHPEKKILNYCSSREIEFTCESCNSDWWGKNGYGRKVFRASYHHIKDPVKSNLCRCPPVARYTEEERMAYIKHHLRDGGKFISGDSREFLWSCNKGHLNKHDFYKIRYEYGCSECAKDRRRNVAWVNGYYPDRASEEDYLYVLLVDNLFIKVGRSFSPVDRFYNYAQESGYKINRVEVLQMYTGNHTEVFNEEQTLLEELSIRGFTYNKGYWFNESFSYDSLPFINEYLSETPLSIQDSEIKTKIYRGYKR